MRTPIRSMSAAVVLAAAGAAHAQVTMELFHVEDLSILSAADAKTTGFWIGNNPSCIAWDGTNLYVGGYNNTNPGDPINIRIENCPWVQVVKIENVLGTRSFRALIDQSLPTGNVHDVTISTRRSLAASPPTNDFFRGISGLSFDERTGLAISIDYFTGFGPAGQMMTYDVTTQLNPIPTGSSPSGGSNRGRAVPAWDFGFDGNGFDWTVGNGGTDAPVVAHVDTDGDPSGPFGLDPTTMDAAFGATVYEPATGGPTLNGPDPMGVSVSGTIWRALDIHPTNGTMAARADGDVVIATRNPGNGVTIAKVVDEGSIPFTEGHRVDILHGFPGGEDLVVYNDRIGTFSGQAFADVVKFVDMQGNPETVTLLDDLGGTFSPPANIGYYDFDWDEANQYLLIMDFTDRVVYFFRPQVDCPADLTGEGDVNTNDFFAFLVLFQQMDLQADFFADGMINTNDFFAFLAAYQQGC